MAGDDFSDNLIKYLMAKTFEGESRIVENWNDIIASRHTVRTRQWLGSMAGLGGVMVGLAMIGVPLARAGGLTTLLDVVLFGCVAALLVLGIIGGVGWSLSGQSVQAKALLSVLAGGLALLVAILVALRIGEPDWWHAPAAVVGGVILIPSVAYAYNQLFELIDPMGWVSAMERRMLPYFTQRMQIDQEPEYTRLVPAYANGRTHATSSGPRQTPPLDPDDLNLIAFIEGAQTRGLSRRAWLSGKVKLRPTNTRMTRDVYDVLVGEAARWGFVKPGGEGVGAEWLIEPDQALEILREGARAAGVAV